MKKTLLILILSIAFTSCAKSQSNLNLFAEELCNSFKSSDLDKPKAELFKLVQTKSNEIYKKYPEELNSLVKEFKTKYPNKTQQEIALFIGEKISLQAIKKCQTFQKITQKISITESKKENKSVTNVANKMCELLNNSSDKSSATLNKIVNDKLFNLVIQNKKLIEEEYGSFSSSEYKKDLNKTLMKECDIYFKLTMGEN
ncbi:hypothetical protein GSB9_03213 [Flavobacteriaceae bacterium GSB9]|nr:hypothetical protein GSB9_03213 [Flavobacteriaceae bacterium GSB9]